MLREVFRRIDPVAVVAAGLAAGAAFYAVMEVDLRVTGRNVDDRIFLAGPFVSDAATAKRVGSAIHVANSLGFAALYALLEPKIPGPPWWKGTLFFNVENVVLYPLTSVGDRHPAIRDGRIDDYWTWPAFLQSIPRHVAYGAVLGVVYDKVRRSRSG